MRNKPITCNLILALPVTLWHTACSFSSNTSQSTITFKDIFFKLVIFLKSRLRLFFGGGCILSKILWMVCCSCVPVFNFALFLSFFSTALLLGWLHCAYPSLSCLSAVWFFQPAGISSAVQDALKRKIYAPDASSSVASRTLRH